MDSRKNDIAPLYTLCAVHIVLHKRRAVKKAHIRRFFAHAQSHKDWINSSQIFHVDSAVDLVNIWNGIHSGHRVWEGGVRNIASLVDFSISYIAYCATSHTRDQRATDGQMDRQTDYRPNSILLTCDKNNYRLLSIVDLFCPKHIISITTT